MCLGSLYEAKAFQELCQGHGIEQSMGSVGDCYDNAKAESWFATLKRECVLETDPLKSAKELRRQVIVYIESWHNSQWLHASLGNRSRSEYELQLKWAKSDSQMSTALPN